MRRPTDLVITAAVAILTCAAVVLGAPVPVTAVLGLVLLAAPGYLLGQLLFGSRIAGLERMAVATGLALCVPILGGLLLDALGVPLHRAEWLGLLAGTTLLGDLALFWRRRGGQVPPVSWHWASARLPIPHVAALSAAVVVAGGALGLACVSAATQHDPGFTQLWLAPPKNKAGPADLGVGNYEGKTMRYRLVLLRNGHPATTWNLTLANGQTWQRSPAFSRSTAIAADLYRWPDLARPYRYIAIEANGVPGS